jgi:hypothetical protein
VLKDGGKSFDLANYPYMFMVRLAFKLHLLPGIDCHLNSL